MSEQKLNHVIPIEKIKAKKRIVYGVVYAPMKPDSHSHFMNSATIEDCRYCSTVQLTFFWKLIDRIIN